MFRQTTLRVAAAIAVVGSLALAGCGGGGSKSMLPIAANGATAPATSLSTTASLTVSVPTSVGATSTSTQRTILSGSKKPAYIDTTTANSTIVVSVTPQDPAEAAQFGNLTVCYNLYTGGNVAPAQTGFAPTPTTGNVTSVRVSIPAPPGTDGYQITQYAGQCGTTPYTVPTAPPGTVGSNNILSQTPITYAFIVAGATNDLNVQIANCGPGSATVPCNPGIGPGPGATLTASIAIAKVQFDAKIPITNPVREQGFFLNPGTKTIGVPIPLEGVNAAGTVVPGLTTPLNPNGGAGPFPTGVTVTLSETGPSGTPGNPAHAKLFLMDALNGAIAQTGAGATQSISITEFNALAAADRSGGAVAGDPWVLVLTYDGTGFSSVVSETVTATATAPSAALPAPISLTITPQSAVWSAANAASPNGYPDPAVPTAPVGLIQPVAAGTIYMSDGASLKFAGVGGATPVTTGSTPAATINKLTGIAFAAWPNPTSATKFIYGVDQGQAGSGSNGAELASGVYAFSTTSTATVPIPVTAQAGSGNWMTFSNPVGVVEGVGNNLSKYYLFVIDSTGAIYKLDIANSGAVDGGGFQVASNTTPAVLPAGTIAPGTSPYLGTATLASGQFLIADPGHNRIVQIDGSQATPAVSVFATGQPFTGLTLTATGTAAYATTTSGQIYYISAQGATPISMGFAASTTQTDGPIGQFASLAPTATPALTPVNYPLQFQNTATSVSFFNTTATPAKSNYATPYTVLPFAAAGPVFSVVAAGIGLAQDTSAANVTGNGTINATAGILLIPSTTAPTAALTPGSFLFTDVTNKLLRTIVQ